MAIKQLLELIGDDIVIAKLDKVGKKGEEVLNSLNKTTPDLKLNVDSGPIEQTTGHVVKLTEVLHTLRPVLQAAGLQFSEFGALTRLAGTSLLALGAATAGAVVVGLAKLEENAARTKGVLADLFGSSAKGDQAFANLDKQANQFGTTVEGLAPGLQAFQQALNSIDRTAQGFRALKEEDLPGAQLAKNADAVSEAYGNFIKLLRAGRLTQDEAEKSAKAFFDAFKDGGPITSAALRNLPVGTLNELKNAFGQAGLTAKQFFALADTGAISIDSFEKALINFGPQAQQAFDNKAIKSFSDEIGKLLKTLSDGFKSLSGGTPFSDFIIGELKRIREGIQATIDDAKRLQQIDTATGSDAVGRAVTAARDFIRDLTTPPKQGFDEAGFTALGEAVQKLPPKFLDASNSLQKLGGSGLVAGSQVAQGMDQASASLQQLRDKAKVTGQELQDVVVGSTRFTGRLNQIPVFEPQLAGESSAAAAKAIQKSFIDNPLFKEGVTLPVKPEIEKDAFQQNLETLQSIINDKPIEIKPVVPTDSQQLITDTFTETGTQSATNFNTAFQSTIPETLNLFQALRQSIVDLFSQPIPVNFESGGVGGSLQPVFAGGGMVRGRGSNTSDSILAWLSNQEFVVNARAVSHYGPDLFAALNAMRLPRDFLSRFSMGGLARSLGGNRLAAGGQVRSGNPVVLKIDRQSFNMTAGDDTITQLKRFAVASQLSSTGRKPRWVK